ncbi:hypothetical protein IC235_21615 [Hymenobacter sp. BT664]|uniref:Lipoprotein n=1 Tax=Hymenobacter montanus TaxID=2771359 RepID=A0A927BHE2_9BACT|nr:hypothetical protein [Hymenobacter montanus]MBD2770491.1 hypothetical protein [Hymenobacter montanus]
MKKHLLSKANALLLMLMCSCVSKEPGIDSLLKSKKATDVISAFYTIGNLKDTSYVRNIFIDPYDPRVSHDYRFLGISVYQSKMIAIKKISGCDPPAPITYRPDSSIVKFYQKWAISKGFKISCHLTSGNPE